MAGTARLNAACSVGGQVPAQAKPKRGETCSLPLPSDAEAGCGQKGSADCSSRTRNEVAGSQSASAHRTTTLRNGWRMRETNKPRRRAIHNVARTSSGEATTLLPSAVRRSEQPLSRRTARAILAATPHGGGGSARVCVASAERPSGAAPVRIGRGSACAAFLGASPAMRPRAASRRRGAALHALACAALAACACAEGSAAAGASTNDATLLHTPFVQLPTQVRHCWRRRADCVRRRAHGH